MLLAPTEFLSRPPPLRRCSHELGLYKEENAKLQGVVDKLAADGACDHDIKKQARRTITHGGVDVPLTLLLPDPAALTSPYRKR